MLHVKWRRTPSNLPNLSTAERRFALGTRSLADLLAAASRDLLGSPLVYSEDALANMLSPRHFVEVRATLGGPAPRETARAAAASRAELEADERWWNSATAALTDAERQLGERSAGL